MKKKYIDADILKAEIERRRDGALERQKNLEKIGQETVLNEMIAFELNRLISFVASLQQEQSVIKKSNVLFDKCVENCDPTVMKEVSDNVDKMLASERLEEEMDEIWLEYCEDVDYLTYASIARHFAEWGMNQAKKEDEK